MKTFLLARLSLLALCFGLTVSAAQAQAQTPASTPPTTQVYTEDATGAGSGYWSITTDAAQPDYSLVQFYTADHQQIYEERVEGLCLDPSQGTAKCRRTARMLSHALAQVQQTRTKSLITSGLGIPRRVQRTFAAR